MKHAHLFVDEAELEVQSGSGGNGNVSFRREKYVPRGGPNGGDGGRGGDVVLVADTNVATLLDLKSARRIKADDGEPGGTNDKKGASGADVEIHVPVGTLVFALETLALPRVASRARLGSYSGDLEAEGDLEGDLDEEDGDPDDAKRGDTPPEDATRGDVRDGDARREYFEALAEAADDAPERASGGDARGGAVDVDDAELPIADLTQDGQRIVVARGGRGGLGNARFKTPTRQAPDFATPGKPGQLKRIRLSLKLMADVGLVGFPNAGKSTLLRRISAARPRVANYPFTTLVPSLGVVERGERRIVVADIPGLIEGASEGAGLGHQFLRHVERTRVLIHLLDVETVLMQERDLVADYHAIRRELGRYRPELLERREIVALSKCDLMPGDPRLEAIETRLRAEGIDARRISSATNSGIDALLAETFDAVDRARREDAEHEAAANDPNRTNAASGSR
ncbi:MAG: Obg family GTPase CgtA [Myxococcota bacterium]